MVVNGRLTAPPQVEAAVVTNSVPSLEPRQTARRFRAKAIDLDTFVSSAGSRSRTVRSGGRACPVAFGPHRQTQHLPANASHRLFGAREDGPAS